jgi:hypothetical protein
MPLNFKFPNELTSAIQFPHEMSKLKRKFRQLNPNPEKGDSNRKADSSIYSGQILFDHKILPLMNKNLNPENFNLIGIYNSNR